MKRPYDLMAFLDQEQRADRLEDLKNEMSEKSLVDMEEQHDWG